MKHDDTTNDSISKEELAALKSELIEMALAGPHFSSIDEIEVAAQSIIQQADKQTSDRGERADAQKISSEASDGPLSLAGFYSRVAKERTISGVIRLLHNAAKNLGFCCLRVYIYNKYQGKLTSIGAAGRPNDAADYLRKGVIEKYRNASSNGSHSFVCLDRDCPVVIRSCPSGIETELIEGKTTGGFLELNGIEECPWLEEEAGRVHTDFPFGNGTGKVSVDFGPDQHPDDLDWKIQAFEPYVTAAGERIALLYLKHVEVPVQRAATIAAGCHSFQELGENLINSDSCSALSCDELRLFHVSEDDHGTQLVSLLAMSTRCPTEAHLVLPGDPEFAVATSNRPQVLELTAQSDLGDGLVPIRSAADRGRAGWAYILPVSHPSQGVLAVLVAYRYGNHAHAAPTPLQLTLQHFINDCLQPSLLRIREEDISLGYPKLWPIVSEFAMNDAEDFKYLLRQVRDFIDLFPGSDEIESIVLGLKTKADGIQYFRVAGRNRDELLRSHSAKEIQSLTALLMCRDRSIHFDSRLADHKLFDECSEITDPPALLSSAVTLRQSEGSNVHFGQLMVFCRPESVILHEHGRLLSFLADRIAEDLARRRQNSRYLQGIREEIRQYQKRLKRSVANVIQKLCPLLDVSEDKCNARELVGTVNEILQTGVFRDAAKIEALGLEVASRKIVPNAGDQSDACDKFFLREVVAEAAASSGEGVPISNDVADDLLITAPKEELTTLLFKILSVLRLSARSKVRAQSRISDTMKDRRVELLIEGLGASPYAKLMTCFSTNRIKSLKPEIDDYESVVRLVFSTAFRISESMCLSDGRTTTISSEPCDSGERLVISIPVYHASA